MKANQFIKNMSQKTKSVLMRFLKGTISGAVSSMTLVSLATPVVWSDFKAILFSLAIAGVFGGLTGLLLALEKWSSWVD